MNNQAIKNLVTYLTVPKINMFVWESIIILSKTLAQKMDTPSESCIMSCFLAFQMLHMATMRLSSKMFMYQYPILYWVCTYTGYC